jgi:hypothetical protein
MANLKTIENNLTQSDVDKASELIVNFPSEFMFYLRQYGDKYSVSEQDLDDIESDLDPDDPNWSEVFKVYKDLKKAPTEFLSWMLRTGLIDIEHAPPFLFMDFIGYSDGWLSHYANDGQDIWCEGFKYGVSHIYNLGFTMRSREEGIFGFAFEATEAHKFGFSGAGRERYGSDLVMFRGQGIKVHHRDDKEDQVIFLNQAAKDFVWIKKFEEGYGVVGSDKNFVFVSEKLENAVSWVISNYETYKDSLHCQ